MFRGKKYKENASKYDSFKEYSLDDALDLLGGFAKPNFDESVDISVNLGVDPRHADQLIRGAVSLPHGTGKKVKAVVVTKEDDKAKECIEAGAADAGSKDLLEKIGKGWLDFDVLIASAIAPSEMSTPVTSNPLLANSKEKYPGPQPISKIFDPFVNFFLKLFT